MADAESEVEIDFKPATNLDVTTEKASQPVADDDGEIVSDGEGGIATASVGIMNEKTNSTKPGVSVVCTDATQSVKVEPYSTDDSVALDASQQSTEEHSQHQSFQDEPNSLQGLQPEEKPKKKKIALEHLRNMKFSKHDPFNDSINRERSFRYDRSSNEQIIVDTIESEMRRKRSHDDKKRHRRSISPSLSQHISSFTDPVSLEQQQYKRQRSTMYFIMQNNSGGSVDHHQQCHQNNNSNTSIHHQLPSELKNILQTSGHLKQKLESLLALKDEHVFGLAAADLNTLVLYTVELSMEQDRLLAGRKAQLKQLDQMIQKEQALVERIIQELPSQLRSNIPEMLGSYFTIGKSPNSTPLYGASNGLGTDAFTSASTSSPASYTVSSANPIIGARVNGQPPTVAALPVANFNVPPPNFNDSQTSSFSHSPSLSGISKLEPAAAADFSKPPPFVSSTVQTKQQQLPSAPQSILQSASVDTSKPLASAAGVPLSFSTPPLLVHNSFAPSSSSTLSSMVSTPSSSQISINISVPPPNIVCVTQTAAPVNTSSTLPKISNLTAPPPPIDFSLPPPAANPADSVNLTSADLAKSSASTLKSSYSSSSISTQAQFNPTGTSSAAFSIPPPRISKSPVTLPSTNITAALDLSVPPPSLLPLKNTVDKVSSTLPQLNQPPSNLQTSTSNSTTTSMQQLSQSIFASVAASLKQHLPGVRSALPSCSQTQGLRPLMSLDHPLPSMRFMPNSTPNAKTILSNIPSLASLSQRGVVIKRQQQKQRNQGGRVIKRLLGKKNYAKQKVGNLTDVKQHITSQGNSDRAVAKQNKQSIEKSEIDESTPKDQPLPVEVQLSGLEQSKSESL